MREIKFRGKSRKDGRWIFGLLGLGSTGNQDVISGFGNSNHQNQYSILVVRLESVGQFTGLKDNNGVDIYEGDIFRKGLGEVFYDTKSASFMVKWHDPVWKRIRSDNPSYKDGEPIFQNYFALEVIGNIHDNPELLQ